MIGCRVVQMLMAAFLVSDEFEKSSAGLSRKIFQPWAQVPDRKTPDPGFPMASYRPNRFRNYLTVNGQSD